MIICPGDVTNEKCLTVSPLVERVAEQGDELGVGVRWYFHQVGVDSRRYIGEVIPYNSELRCSCL